MEIKYKNKPTQQLIDRYCRKIEDYLSVHQLKIEIELYNAPCTLVFMSSDTITKKELLWIKNVKIIIKGAGQTNIRLNRRGFEDNISDHDIWIDAWNIQEQLYKHLDIKVNVEDRDDSYWYLWSKHP